MEETALRDKLRTPPTSGTDGVTAVQKKQSKSPIKLLGRICNPKQNVGQGYRPDAFYAKISNTTIKPQKGSKQDIMEGVYTPFGTYQSDEQINDKDNSITTESVSYKLNYVEGRSVSWSKMRLGKANGLVEYEGHYTNGNERVLDVGTLTVNGFVLSGEGSDRLGGYYCSGTVNQEEVLIYRTRKEDALNDTFSVGDRVYAQYRGTSDLHYPGIVTKVVDGIVAIAYLDGDEDPILSVQFVVKLNKFTPYLDADKEIKDDTIKCFEKKEKMLRGEDGTTTVEDRTSAVPPLEEEREEESFEELMGPYLNPDSSSANAGGDITMMDGEEEEKEKDGHNLGKTGSTSSEDKEPEMKHAVGARVKNEGTDKYGIIEKIVNGKYHIKEDDGTTLIEPMDEDDFGSEYIVVPHSAGTHDDDDADNDNDSGKSGDDMSEDDDTLDNDKSAIEADLNDLQDNGNGEDEEGSEANDDKKKTKKKLLDSIRPSSRKKKNSEEENKEDSKKKDGGPSFSLFKSKGLSEQVGKDWEKEKSDIQQGLVKIDEKDKKKLRNNEVKQNTTNLMWSSFENDDGMKADVKKLRKKFDTARDAAIEPLIEMLMGESERDTLKEYLLKSLKSDLMKDFKNGGE